jgi:ubiquinone/menaquinone biosynthesis C-methylase UbiE
MESVVGVKDKTGLIERMQAGSLQRPILVDVGCGESKIPGSIGVDLSAHENVDIVGDAIEVLRRFPESSVDGIVTRHFVEHVDDLQELLREFVRVTRPGGNIEVVAPHFSNPYFYSDPTHRTFFGLYSFCYFAASDLFSRSVPTYSRLPGLELVQVDLIFKSARPFYLRHGLKRLAGMFFNSCIYMRELYEEFFTYVVPCYEVRYQLVRTSDTR